MAVNYQMKSAICDDEEKDRVLTKTLVAEYLDLHNYTYHFGSLKDLRVGDTVTFTDMDGQTVYYEVEALVVLGPYDVEEMTSGEFDLMLFTCNCSRKACVTVRRDRVEK